MWFHCRVEAAWEQRELGKPESRYEDIVTADLEDEETCLTEEQKEHKKKFQEWRKNHYDEFKQAKKLLQQVTGERKGREEGACIREWWF